MDLRLLGSRLHPYGNLAGRPLYGMLRHLALPATSPPVHELKRHGSQGQKGYGDIEHAPAARERVGRCAVLARCVASRLTGSRS